ncbi:uncharacterized protein K444DRAFT_631742 [Hyaloscypha bicolor E]|uniref:Transmembrane protein n=1 Tax=Hyaloscypha bicolor E TaxID=1095630 RepID=A0A2J6T3E0_9HELO|nr:uncharacterized protein K444DRAFT_631742 [Hyaloscypha bicolor E]PMD57551.1 hypothetical protein K444DRAFT_631742 [Hyaloscypha bicolor E]
MKWTPTTLLLHLLWGWQFALCCAGEVVLLLAIGGATTAIGGATRPVAYFSCVLFLYEPNSDIKHSWAWLLFIATAFSAVLVLGEVCLFANDQLTPIIFLGFQTGKLAYAVLVFILFLVFSTMHETEYLWHFVLGVAVFCPPWILTFFLAVLIQVAAQTPVKQEAIGNGDAEIAPERAPLLPAQIPSPRLPSQRIAVQRYPSSSR